MKDILLWDKKGLFKYVLGSTIIVFEFLLSNLILAKLVGVVQNRNLKQFYIYAALLVGSIFFSAIMFITSRILRIGYMRDTTLFIREKVFNNILNKNIKAFNKNLKSDYISNLINDINIFEEEFFKSFVNLILSFTIYVASLIILLYLNYKLAIIMFFTSIIIFYITKTFQKRTIKIQEKVQRENAKFTSNISNTFSGLEILKLNRIEDRFLENSKKEMEKLETDKSNFMIFTFWQLKFTQFLGTFILILIIYYMLGGLSSGESIARSMFTVQMANATIWPITEIMPLINSIKSQSKVIENIFYEKEIENYMPGDVKYNFEKEIELRNVTFYYEDKLIFKDANLKIEKGKKYLLKGESGAGKSTLINLLSKVNEDYEGEILIDGVNLRKIDIRSFNENVSFIDQDVFLFEDTIENNIKLFKNYGSKHMHEAIKSAGLEDFIKSKENGINNKIEENGKNISGGERQRISIARAIIRQPKILFADEVTSSLDTDLGKYVEQTILNLNTTVISVSHRFYEDVTSNYDYIIEILNGKIMLYNTKSYFKGGVEYEESL